MRPSARTTRDRLGTWPRPTRAVRRGFTLLELMTVIVIIGIIVGMIMVASYQGLERAKERATQALITKLDQGITDRLDALMANQVDPTGTHKFLAAVSPPGVSLPWGLPSDQRAQVIAQLDYLKREMPDVWLYNPSDPQYPVNFAGVPYPLSGSPSRADYLLPVGHMARAYRYGQVDAGGDPFNGPGDNEGINSAGNAEGIYGASFNARAGFYKALFAAIDLPPQGCDGIDNDGNGLADEMTASEWGNDPNFAANMSKLTDALKRHKHITARSECLYALLISGSGPLGSIFSADDFGPNEVADTDGDGLPEFVDGWGQPLQFYRWPTHYASQLQHGYAGYSGAWESRDIFPLDGNNQLVAPAWWGRAFNVNSGAGFGAPSGALYSDSAQAVMSMFVPLNETEPWPAGQAWDRSGSSTRRAYYCRPLIISPGPDQKLGLGQLNFNYVEYGGPSVTLPANALNVIAIENTAANLSPVRDTSNPMLPEASGDEIGPLMRADWGLDDISNQNIQTSGGGVR